MLNHCFYYYFKYAMFLTIYHVVQICYKYAANMLQICCKYAANMLYAHCFIMLNTFDCPSPQIFMLCTLIVALTRLPPGLRLLRHLSKMTKFRNCTNIVGACREVSCFTQFYWIVTHYFHQTLAFVFTIIVY